MKNNLFDTPINRYDLMAVIDYVLNEHQTRLNEATKKKDKHWYLVNHGAIKALEYVRKYCDTHPFTEGFARIKNADD